MLFAPAELNPYLWWQIVGERQWAELMDSHTFVYKFKL